VHGANSNIRAVEPDRATAYTAVQMEVFNFYNVF
jgi:hypothetical protein